MGVPLLVEEPHPNHSTNKRPSDSLGEETTTPRSDYPTKRFISSSEVAARESERAAMQAGELWLIYPVKALGTS